MSASRNLDQTSDWRAAVVFLVAATGILLSSCSGITVADVSGEYIRSRDGVIDTVILATDGTFRQTITFTNGGQWSKTGSWKFSPADVEFDEFYQAFQIDPPPNKTDAVLVIPPLLVTTTILEVQKGKLLKNSVEPIWFKQPKK